MNPWQNEIVAGNDVFVVGGGPSFDDIQPHWLDWKPVICVNNIVHKFARTKAAVQAVVTMHPEHAHHFNLGWPIFALNAEGSRHITFAGCDKISSEPGKLYVHGTSGAAAVNLAMIWGAKRIFTIGLDFGVLENRPYCRGYSATKKREDSWSRRRQGAKDIGPWPNVFAVYTDGGIVADAPWAKINIDETGL